MIIAVVFVCIHLQDLQGGIELLGESNMFRSVSHLIERYLVESKHCLSTI